MRIGLVCPYSLTVPGGVQTQALGLLRSFRAMGHEARLLAPCDGPPPDAGVTPLGNSIATSANGSIAPLAPDPSAALRTIRALRDEDFDVLHLHEPLAPGATVTAALFSNSPMVGTFHAAGDSAAYRWLMPLTRWVAKRLTERCAVSEDARKLAHEALGGEYRLLYNGIETDLYTKAAPTPTDRPTIFFVGRHEPRKGLDVLLEAMASLPADTRLWVGSDGSDTAELKARFAGDMRVEWLGRLTDAEKASRMQGADVFCAPSLRGESFGVVLLEAMAASTPVVASDLPGYRNVAIADRDALLVPAGDPEKLAAAIQRVLTDRALAARLSAAGDARAREFSMDSLAEAYLEIYEGAIETHAVRAR